MRDAAQLGAPPTGAPIRIDADGTLREALSALLDGADALAVTDGGNVAGTLAFDDVRRAIAQSVA